MKRTLAILLVLAMLVCMVPAFTVSAAEENTSCTIKEYNKDETKLLLDNIVYGGGVGWYYYYAANDANLDANWKTTIPTGWTALKDNETFSRVSNLPAGFKNVWDAENNRDLWAVRKVTITADEYDLYKDKPVTSYMKHCDNVEVYVNGALVLKDPRGFGWTNDLTTFNLTSNGVIGGDVLAPKDLFLKDNTTGDYYAYVAAHVHRNNDAFWFDMNLEVLVEEYKGEGTPYTEVTVANADQWNDYVKQVNLTRPSVNGSVPVTVTVTGNLDFTGKSEGYVPINNLKNTTIDFGGNTVSNLQYVDNIASAGQTGLFAVAASDGAQIKNLVLDNCSISVTKSSENAWVGAIVGWGSGLTLENITLNNVAVTNGCDNTADGFHGAAAALIGVADGVTTLKGIRMTNVTLNAPMNAASFVTGRAGAANTWGDITVSKSTVNALRFGSTTAEQLSFKNPTNVTVGENVSLDFTLRNTLAASNGSYTAYLQTRAGEVEDTYDFRIIVVASQSFIDTVNTLCGRIDFKATFRNGTASENVEKALTANTVYPSVSATDAAGNKEVYEAVNGCYIFGWVITGVPSAYASTTGETMPVLNLDLKLDGYTKDAYDNLTIGNYWNAGNEKGSQKGTGYPVYAADFDVRYTLETLPVGSVITIDGGWSYRPECWLDTEGVEKMNPRRDFTDVSVIVVTEEWWGDYTYVGFNVFKTAGGNLVASDEVDTRLTIYTP